MNFEEEELIEIPEEKAGKHKDGGGRTRRGLVLLKENGAWGTPRRLGLARGVHYRHTD